MIYDRGLNRESDGCSRLAGGEIDLAWFVDGGLNQWCAHASSTKLEI